MWRKRRNTFVIDYVVQATQCDDCKKTYTPHTWNALVQVRQHTDHKRTIYFLEQVIMKHNVHEHVLDIEEKSDGLDFQFASRQHAQTFSDFIQNYFVARTKNSKQLISHDSHNMTYYHKYTILCDLSPICKDDLVLLNKMPGFSSKLGLLLCDKVTSSIRLVDPFSSQNYDISAVTYWKVPFNSILKRRHLTEFIILDIEKVTNPERPKNSKKHIPNGKRYLAEAEIARTADLGSNDERLVVRTHLGGHLKVGDLCAGYDLRTINLSGIETEIVDQLQYDVILVRKIYFKDSKTRNWTLKELHKRKNSATGDRRKDVEDFKIDIEEDLEMRKEVNLYKNPKWVPSANPQNNEDDIPEIQLAELLEDLTLDETIKEC
eukprot:GHVL01014029.1.p1 GENE.GHVL01014029.1~~GHVL01014029.1.p1  ORF type:complete len:376 (-),score=49.51 GHVL01014029.1:1034-2161(-)